MNTILIWDECGNAPVQFFVLDGDQERYANTYINKYTEIEDEQLRQDELNDIVYDENGYKVTMLQDFPHESYCYGQTRVIVAGFLP